MIARLVRLKPYVVLLEGKPEYEKPAINWNNYNVVLATVFHFYLLEQILQRDAANALHLSFCWLKVRDLVTGLLVPLEGKEVEEDVVKQVDVKGLRAAWRNETR